MKNCIIGLMALTFFSCNRKAKESCAFQLIDLSVHQDWTDYFCFKVYNDGRTYIYEKKHNRKEERYFHLMINKNEIKALSSIVKEILSLKLDTVNKKCRFDDCDCYNLIINTKEKTFKSFAYGGNSNKSIEYINNLADFLLVIAYKSPISIDSTIAFESRTKEFYPPQIKETIKFTPPEK